MQQLTDAAELCRPKYRRHSPENRAQIAENHAQLAENRRRQHGRKPATYRPENHLSGAENRLQPTDLSCAELRAQVRCLGWACRASGGREQ